MRLGWDEIKRRAKAFSEEWKDAHYEKGETQSFYNDFFEIFGVRRRTVADYERRVKLLDNKQGFMDLFWPRVLLVEQKSARLDLGKAEGQAMDYLTGTPLPVWPISTIPTRCRRRCARPTPRSIWRWTGSIARLRLPATETGSSICSGAMKHWSIRSGMRR